MAARPAPLKLADQVWQLPLLVVLVLGVSLAFGDHELARFTLLLCGLAAYLVMVRWGVWTWLAALAVVPAAVGGGLLQLADGDDARGSVLLGLAVTAGLVAATWRARHPATVLALGAGMTVVGLVGRHLVESGDPARLHWSSVAPLFLVALPVALGLFAAAGLARAGGIAALRLVCGLTAAAPLVALLLTDGDGFAVLVWWPAAGALGITALLRGRRGSGVDVPQVDDVDQEAMAAFTRDHGRPALAPVAIVIAAYNEADGLPAVLAALPEKVCNLPAEVIVVDDGSSDGTAEAAEAALADLGRGHVVACPTNRGQGAALRLGYRMARTLGATYVVTTDADGQYDVADLSVVLRPVYDGRADFVTGSRRLGSLENRDRTRQVGTYVFAGVASALLGRWLTDTSFGLRAMRAEITAEVTLNQPQYQSSELMVGVASHGYSVLEVPATMHRRTAGSSKKGGNLVYGSRYGRVMLGTWWREGAPRPVNEVAAALAPAVSSTRRPRGGG